MRTYAKLYTEKEKGDPYTRFILTGTCTLCGKAYRNNNLFASSYCPECANSVKREKTRERVRKYRAKQKVRNVKV